MPIQFSIFMEVFASIHMSVFVLIPLSKIIFKNNSNKAFWILFGMRAAILLFFDIFITADIAIFDFFAVFVGAFIIVPISAKVAGTPINIKSNKVLDSNMLNVITSDSVKDVILKCTKCGATLQASDKFCPSCGTPFAGYNAQAIQDTSPIVTFDSTYYAKEKKILKNIIIEEFKNQGDDIKTFTTLRLNKNKNILLTIFGILTLINVFLYYFNYSILFCGIIELILFLIYLLINRKFNVLNVLTKTAIKSPNEDISKLITNIKAEKLDTLMPVFVKMIIIIFLATFIPTIVFFNSKIIYTKYGDGYQVFRYTRGAIRNEKVTIPSTYKGKKVIAIGERAFKNTRIKKVTLPETIESIKIDAFRNAKNIESIILPSSVVEIRANAFANMSNLTHITLPEGLKYIRGGAFAYDTNLIDVKLPSTLEYLGGSAFSHCSSITEITVPKGVTEINGQTFEYMTALKTINLHDDITFIHGEVFIGDISLYNVILPSKITEIRGSTFENCSSLSSIRIPEGVTRIGGHAFYGCSNLSYVYVPETVIEIGSSAFRQCYSLKEITIPITAMVNERAFKESPTSIYYYNN